MGHYYNSHPLLMEITQKLKPFSITLGILVLQVCSFSPTRQWKNDNERILTFGDATMNKLLNSLNAWLLDGVFDLSPESFYRIYKMHFELRGFALPCVHVLLPNKTKKKLIKELLNCISVQIFVCFVSFNLL